MKKLIFLATFCILNNAYGLLPPVWQDVAELKAILESKDLNHYLDSAELIQKVERTEAGWVIITNHSRLFADIKPEPQAMPGPEKFSIQFRRS